MRCPECRGSGVRVTYGHPHTYARLVRPCPCQPCGRTRGVLRVAWWLTKDWCRGVADDLYCETIALLPRRTPRFPRGRKLPYHGRAQ